VGTRGLAGLLCALAFAAPPGASGEEPLKVGSKRFTESYILGEIVAQTVHGEHKPGLGNTAILYEALRSGGIDLYPEYSGTIAQEILRSGTPLDPGQINQRLEPLGLRAGIALGFSNTYALGMRRADAERLGIRNISDLARHDLRFGLSHEFLGRRDGWPGLKAAYGLPHAVTRGLDHGLAYDALAAGQVDVIDLYSTDAKIERYAIALLADDRRFFPPYEAVLLYRADAPQRFPAAFAALARMEKRIDAPTMVRLNARAELDKVPFAQVAAEYLGRSAGPPRTLLNAVFAPDFGRLLAEHVGLVLGSLAAAIAIGVPLGVAAAKVRGLAQPVMITTGLVQTIPALALLAFLIPLTGKIGLWPALLALFLYALLPITRNTHAGLAQVPNGLIQAATALGLRSRQIRWRIELPLAFPTLLAGIKTSAIVNVGTATIAAFIGAGGFGERISQGLALNDHTVLLAGALPAAALALIVHAAFELIERSLGRGPR
jgi:osmoprotectant transport system permease protein